MTTDTATPLSFLKHDSKTIAYRRFLAKDTPTIVFLHGHGSDMDGTKALVVEEWARHQNFGCIRFDYTGHGQSDGNMLDATIGQWKADCLAVIDQLVPGKCYLVGSSLGGWLMLLVAIARPEKISGLIGIAAAPDFTEELIWNALSKDQQKTMALNGQIALPNPYEESEVVYPYQLITEGRDHLVLGGMMPISCPVRLLHGMKDEEVPWQTANRIAEAIAHKNVQVLFDEDANHRFSEPDQLDTLLATLAEITRQTKP